MGPSGTVGLPEPEPYPDLSDPAGARDLSWVGMKAGTSVTVSGGSFAVDTDELSSFATTLDTAAQYLEDAQAHALLALADARSAVAPPETDSDWMSGPEPATPVYMPGFPTVPTYQLNIGTDPSSQTRTFEALRTDAIDAITDLTSGSGSLDDAAGNLRSLASSVNAAVESYGSAESAATPFPIAGGALVGLHYALGLTAPIWPLALMTTLVSHGRRMGGSGELPESLADPLQTLEVLLSDLGLSAWVTSDLLLLVGMGAWAANANTGTESAAIEEYLATVAEDLDPWVTGQLPSQVQVGTQLVEVSSLSAMQRVVYYLAALAETNGAARYGERTGVTVTPRGGRPITVPPGVVDPYGLGTEVTPRRRTDSAGADPAATAGSAGDPGSLQFESMSELIAYGDTVKPTEPGTGAISILRTDHEDGTTSWMVVVPGTSDWGMGSSDPRDLLTNFEAVAGRPTDMETAVVTAMREAGIEPGDEVGIYGHSQGGATAMSIAADPEVAEQFNITSVITAGAPTAGTTLPEGVSAIHFENTADAVPALDGAPTPRTDNRVVVDIDTHESDMPEYPHGQAEYAQAIEGIEGDVDVDAWTQQVADLTGAGAVGGTTVEYVYDITRETAGAKQPG